MFGWRKADLDTGVAGTYQLFSAGGQTIGGMFTKPPAEPVPFWLYYFNVGDIDVAMKSVKAPVNVNESAAGSRTASSVMGE